MQMLHSLKKKDHTHVVNLDEKKFYKSELDYPIKYSWNVLNIMSALNNLCWISLPSRSDVWEKFQQVKFISIIWH